MYPCLVSEREGIRKSLAHNIGHPILFLDTRGQGTMFSMKTLDLVDRIRQVLSTILLQVLIMPDLHSEGWRDAINKKKGLDIHHIRKAFKVGYLVGVDVSSQNT